MIHNPIVGDTYFDENREAFNLIFFDSDEAILKPLGQRASRVSLPIPRDEFEQQVESGFFRPEFNLKHDIDALTEDQKKEVKKREPYLIELQALVDAGHSPTSPKTMKLLKSNVHDKFHIGIHKHGNSSIARWWKEYKDADYKLKKSVSPRKQQPKRTDTSSENFLNQFFVDTWVKGSTANISAGYDAYKKAVEAVQNQNDAIMLLSASTFQRRVDSLNKFNIIFNSGNYAEIKRALRTLSKRIKTSYVMERVEMDRMSLNLCLIDEDGQPTDSVDIYIVIDCHSRYPLSVTYELGCAEDTIGVVNSFKRIFYRTSESLNAFGVANKVIVDNGPGYKSAAFRNVVQRLGCDLIKAPSNEPWKKPFVESFIGTLRSEFFEGGKFEGPDGKIIIGLPGYKGKRTSKNSSPVSSENLKKAAAINVEEFSQLLHDYLVEYVNQPHSSLNGKTPQQVWDESVNQKPLVPVNKALVEAACHYKEETPKLQHRGTVRVDHQFFYSEELHRCARLAKKLNPNQDMSVVVKYDPDDARWVTVIADFDCYETKQIFEKVENRDLIDEQLEAPVSFEELNENKASVKRRDISTLKISQIIKQTTRPRRDSKEVESAKKNASKNLSVAERIKQSNKQYTKMPKSTQRAKDKEEDKNSKNKRKRKNSLRDDRQTEMWPV